MSWAFKAAFVVVTMGALLFCSAAWVAHTNPDLIGVSEPK